MTASAILEIRHEGSVAILTLRRPERRNALNVDLCRDIHRAIGELTDTRVAVITGEGTAFCAGADLTGVYGNEVFWETPLRRPTFVEHFRKAGYHCFGAGKVFHGTFDYATAGRPRAPEAAWRDSQNRPAVWDEFHPNDPEPMPPDTTTNRMFEFDDFENVRSGNQRLDWGVLPDERESDIQEARTVGRVERCMRRPEGEQC